MMYQHKYGQRCTDFSLSNMALGSYFKPYKASSSFKTSEELKFSNPRGCCLHTKELLMFIFHGVAFRRMKSRGKGL